MAGFFGRFVAGSGDTDDQGALCGFDDVVGDGVEFVDLQDPLDLGEEAFEEPEVAAGDPCDGCDGLGVGEVVGVEGLAEGSPVSLEDEQLFVLSQGPVLVGEADSAVELGVVAELLLQAGHAETVTDTDGQIVEGAKVEVWHANSLGNYSFFDKSQSDFNLRRSIISDQDGKYVALTTMPVGYGCPPEGTTQFVLNKLGRHGNRPSHVHYFVSAPGYRKLTTQFNIEGDQYLWDDFAFATREGLVATAVDITDEAEIARRGLTGPFKHIQFNVELVKDQAAAPSTEVERRRASA